MQALATGLTLRPTCGSAIPCVLVPQGWADLPGTVIEAGRGAELVPQGGDADFCYDIIEGCVRTVCLFEDGRRQVGEFLFACDLLETDATFGAEAVTAVTLRRLPRRLIEVAAGNDADLAARLRAYARQQVRGYRAHCVMLGRKTALERVASFLIDMAERLETTSSGAITLPMGRTDVADYLGLTTETVCRAFSELRERGLIRVRGSSVAITSRPGLIRACTD